MKMEMVFWNDYSLDVSRNKEITKKKIQVDYDSEKQLYDIIKKRHQYKVWQPSRKDRGKVIRALETLQSK